MIIDLTKSSLEITSVSSEEQPWSCGGCNLVFDPDEGHCPRCGGSVCPPKYEEFNWDAYRDWLEFRNARISQRCTREEAIDVMKAALLDDHMRTALKQCSRRAIRPEVVKIIDRLIRSYGYFLTPSSHFAIEAAAARIVDLDFEEQRRREAKND